MGESSTPQLKTALEIPVSSLNQDEWQLPSDIQQRRGFVHLGRKPHTKEYKKRTLTISLTSFDEYI